MTKRNGLCVKRLTSAKKRNIAILLCSAAVLVGASLTTLFRGPAQDAPSHNGITIGFARVSRPTPAFDLPRLDGRGTIQPGQLQGKPIIINFWSSTCTICRQESPAIAQVAHATRGSAYYLGIDTLDSRSAAMAFVRKYGISYPIAYDAQGVAAARYGVPGLPVTFFLSRTGKQIIGINTGVLTAHSLGAILRTLYGLG